jgi:hypothetical protein
MDLLPAHAGGYVAAPVRARLFLDHIQSISGTLVKASNHRDDYSAIGTIPANGHQ